MYILIFTQKFGPLSLTSEEKIIFPSTDRQQLKFRVAALPKKIYVTQKSNNIFKFFYAYIDAYERM